ncbi:MAG: hypothetical protein M0R17_05240 [Candidatus Omnitrophica bacterium]|jgi:hypothetical protein|nr:hypothetical protein [Candidatus Omnitrophota bacterium]
MHILLDINTPLLPTDEFYRPLTNEWIQFGNSIIGFRVNNTDLPIRRLVTIENSIIFKDHTSMTITIPKSDK